MVFWGNKSMFGSTNIKGVSKNDDNIEFLEKLCFAIFSLQKLFRKSWQSIQNKFIMKFEQIYKWPDENLTTALLS